MRALVLHGPRDARVEEVQPPQAAVGQVVVEVERVGICGTDIEFYTGDMDYLRQGHASYPLRIGHEWVGRVTAIGQEVEERWLGTRVTSDTMLGCGSCERCLGGRHHICEFRHEIGIRGGWPGALAEEMTVPVTALYEIPAPVSPAAAALVEPGANAVRAVNAASLEPGKRLLVFGPGTIGLLVALFALARGVEVHVVGIDSTSLDLARSLGVHRVYLEGEDLSGTFDAVIDATNDAGVPAACLERVDPGGRLVLVGLSGEPGLIDSRQITLGDLMVVGILGGSAGIGEAIAAYADGQVVPDALVSEVIGLEEVESRLAGERSPTAGPGPKTQVDPKAV
ncbi:MAG TPA: alcohol dehydrogenase catalytic domain-containing protein [Acidimicrobiia bacterium]|nr:alcohol dehydrogenase catalytic domain-containing protein [Acidimicrobiia bacterium]